MQETTGNLFDQCAAAICITTNGFVKANGEAVMGRGCARMAQKLWPGIQGVLGKQLAADGPRVSCLTFETGNSEIVILGQKGQVPYHIVAFPVKPRTGVANADCTNVVSHMRQKMKPGDLVPGWMMLAEVELIQMSAKQLVALATEKGWDRVVIPRMGCGAGELNWSEVRESVADILDNRFHIITF